MPPTTADQPCPDEIETETETAAWFNTTDIADLTTHPAIRLRIDNASAKHDPYFDYSNIPISTTTSWARPVHRARKRERSERPGGVIPGFCRSDRPGLEDRTSRGRRTPARHRPGTGPARAGGARANYWIQPAECPRFNAGNDVPRPPCCHPRGIPRHARSGPAAARDLMVAAAWVLLFVLITTFFPA